MAKDKYISARSSVSGFSFANLGIFTGFADGIYNAVYSLVILSIFQNSAIVDIFQYYTSNPENIIARFFDFNCNSLFYRMKTNKIIASAFFYEFLESRTISQQNMLFINNKVVGQYGVPEMVMRAIKFQIQFMDKYEIKTELGFDILYSIYNMTRQDESDMKKYMKSHVSDNKLQNIIWQRYQNIKR